MSHISDKNDTSEKMHVPERRGLEALLEEADRVIGNASFRIFSHWKRQQERRRRWETYPLKIAVLALVKSGKSTLINSWLGDEFLPVSSLPETAHIISIQQQSRFKNAIVQDRGKIRAKGVVKINNYLHKLNRQSRDPDFLPQDHELTLKVPSISLAKHPLGKQSLQIVDMPGLNEASMGQFRKKSSPSFIP